MDAGAVRGLSHRAAEGVDLADEVTLADAADRRIAAHLPERLDALGEEQSARSGAGRGKGRLGTGVTAPDDDDVECLWMLHVPRAQGGRDRRPPRLTLSLRLPFALPASARKAG